MTPHPYRLAALMGVATVAGLVGLMLAGAAGTVPCLLVAAAPAFMAGWEYWRTRR